MRNSIAVLTAATLLAGAWTASAGLTLGSGPTATTYGGVRYRSFNNTGGNEVYAGTDVSSPGTYMVQQQVNWTRPGQNTFVLIYDPIANELRTKVNSNPWLVFSASTAVTSGTPGGPPGPGFTPNDVNYIRMRIQEGDNTSPASTVTVNNLIITPYLGSAIGLGSGYTSPGPPPLPSGTLNNAEWYLVNNALMGGFTMTGDIDLTGIFTRSEEASKIDFYLGHTAVPEPSTYLAGALLLLPFAGATIRRFRK